MTAPIPKACRITAMRVGHSRCVSDKVRMGFSPMFPLRIVPSPGFPVCDGGHKQPECTDEQGRADFELLHSRCFEDEAIVCAFDLLRLDGDDLRRLPLSERKPKLCKLLRGRRTAFSMSRSLRAPAFGARGGALPQAAGGRSLT